AREPGKRASPRFQFQHTAYDTQLRTPPQPEESCSLVPRRKERGASLRDASLLCVAAGFVKNAAELQF
ncbi:hypothetical protein CR513_44892, partial [Mucuna pruriens]